MASDITQLRANQVAQAELWDELRVENGWFHIVRAMILRGILRDIGPNAWSVYCIIKAHANMQSGESYPSVARIAELMGASTDTVHRALKILMEKELVTTEKKGRSNRYCVKESVPLTTMGGELFGHGERQYAPLGFQPFIDELQRFAKTGNIPNDKAISINITVNMQQITQGDNSTVVIQSINVNGEDSPEAIKSKLSKLEALKNIR